MSSFFSGNTNIRHPYASGPPGGGDATAGINSGQSRQMSYPGPYVVTSGSSSVGMVGHGIKPSQAATRSPLQFGINAHIQQQQRLQQPLESTSSSDAIDSSDEDEEEDEPMPDNAFTRLANM